MNIEGKHDFEDTQSPQMSKEHQYRELEDAIQNLISSTDEEDSVDCEEGSVDEKTSHSETDDLRENRKLDDEVEDENNFYSKDEDDDDMTKDYMGNKGELTSRAIVFGCIVGMLVACMNVNLGLRTGWIQHGSIFSAVIVIAFFKLIRSSLPLSRYETVIVTTTASGAGTMASAAGLVSSIPALKMLGYSFSMWELLLWGISVAYFGVYFAIILRKRMIIHEKLRFPCGVATAFTIKAMLQNTSHTIGRANLLIFTTLSSGLYALASFFLPYLQTPPIIPQAISQWGWFFHISPLLMGGGMLAGIRSCASIFLGSIVGWGIIGPLVRHYGWASGPIMHFSGARGWILWVGISMMVADSLVQLITALVYLIKSLHCEFLGRIPHPRRFDVDIRANLLRHTETIDTNLAYKTPQYIPLYVCVVGLILSTCLLTVVGEFLFSIKFYLIWMAIPLGFVLSYIATRCSGEFGINPVGGTAKVTQLAYAGIAPGETSTNILAAGIVGAGASQCCDMMQDFKTGYLVKVSPRKQFVGQCIGIVFGVLAAVPVYKLYDNAYHIGGSQVPAPAAQAWKGVAEVLSKGVAGLPSHSFYGIIFGFLLGITLSVLSKLLSFIPRRGSSMSMLIPSALAFGIGMIIPPHQGLTMFLSAAFVEVWKLLHNRSAKAYFFYLSSGLIAGEGLMGILIALMRLAGVRPLLPVPYS